MNGSQKTQQFTYNNLSRSTKECTSEGANVAVRNTEENEQIYKTVKT